MWLKNLARTAAAVVLTSAALGVGRSNAAPSVGRDGVALAAGRGDAAPSVGRGGVALAAGRGDAAPSVGRGGAAPQPGAAWHLSLSSNATLDMVWISPGAFTMGSPDVEPGHKTDESPLTHVTLTKGYWLGKTEVTIGQWKAITGESLRDHVTKMLSDNTLYRFGGSQEQTLRDFMRFDPRDPDRIMANEDDNLPMYFVSWNDAMDFCRKLTTAERNAGRIPEGYEYTLPTEAQWEYACRAGTTGSTFAGSFTAEGRAATLLDSIAWYGGDNAATYQGRRLGNPGAGPRGVGEKAANPWGLQDMQGNLWEWCRDWYGPYPGGSVSDPLGPLNGNARVNRGGSWGSGPYDERSDNRAENPQPEKSAYRGFRLALCPVQARAVDPTPAEPTLAGPANQVPARPLTPPAPGPRYHALMDQNWKFLLGDPADAEGVSFDDHTWRSLDLPHDWSIEGDFDKTAPTGGGGGYLPTGIGWYRKTFTLPRTARGQIVHIQFDGVYMNSDVWINGHHLGHRPSGYISFVYDLTPYLKAGKNTLAVRVDNSAQPNSRWYSGSGIYRHVWLDILPPLHIGQWGTYVTTSDSLINIHTTLVNNTREPRHDTLVSNILDASGNTLATQNTPVDLAPGDSTVFTQQIPLEAPTLWSPEHPNGYTLASIVRSKGKTVDAYQTPFGVRTLEYSAVDGFLLNGKRIKMNGVCLHGDAGCLGVAVPIRVWEERLALLKEMGCNAIRTSHNPVAPEVLDLCDRMSFLVMDEAFDAWESGKVKNDYHLYFDEWGARDVADQIHRDRNHPSVVLWSAGNEIPDQTKDKGVELLKSLREIYHREDSTRPLTTANDDIVADGGSTLLPFMEAEDIVGYNYVDRWHERRELFYGPDHYAHPDWKMIGTESESVHNPSTYSLGNDPDRPMPNYTSGMIRAEQLWKFVAVHDYVIGDFMWTGIDYLGEARWPGKGSSSGVIDMTNRPKDSYYFYQSQWTDQPVLHLLPSWNWQGREGQILPVLAYTNCDTVELYLNGKFYGAKSREFPRQGNSGAWNKYARPYVNITTADLHLSWDLPYEPGVIKAVGRRNGQTVATVEIRTAGKPAALRASADIPAIFADGSDVATVHVDVVDSAGNVVPYADNLIRFRVSGNGRLAGVDNGNQQDDHSFRLDERNAFNGHAYAVLSATRTPGVIHLTIEADGLQGTAVEVSTVKPGAGTILLENLR